MSRLQKISVERPQQRIYIPGSHQLVLDASQCFPDDPGQGTPALVIANNRETMTFWCAVDGNCGDLGLRPDVADRLESWLAEHYDEVCDWSDYHFAEAERKQLAMS